MRKLIIALALCSAPSLAWAQNPTCPTRPTADSTNACASTAFVHNAINGVGPGLNSGIYDIRAYGGVCNGTDQNTAVQAAIAAGGKRIYIPTGCTWVVPSGIIPAGLIIWGEDPSNTGSVVKSAADPTTRALQLGPGSELVAVNAQGSTVNSPTNCPMHRVINVTKTNMIVISTCYSSWDQQSGEDGVDRTGVFFKVGSMPTGQTGDALNLSNCGGFGGCSFTGNALRADNYSGLPGVAAIYGTAQAGAGNGVAIVQTTNNSSNSPVHWALFDTNRTQGSVLQMNHRTSGWTTGDFIRLDAADISGSFTANFQTYTNAGNLRWQIDYQGIARSTGGFANINTSNAIQSFLADNGASVYVSSNAAGTHGTIMAHGADTWSSISDARLKKNIQTLSVLDRLRDYRAVGYDWKDTGRHDVGVIAQELVKVFPELVNLPTPQDDRWSVSYDRLGALALQGVKELQAEIEALRSEVKRLSNAKQISRASAHNGRRSTQSRLRQEGRYPTEGRQGIQPRG